MTAHDEAQLQLGPDVDDEPEEGSRMVAAWHRPGEGTPEFDRLCRLLLGVEDDTAKVTVTMAGGTDDPYGWGVTLEDWTEITVECAGRLKVLPDMPALLGALEVVAAGPLTRERVAPLIEKQVTARFPNGVTWACTVGNCNEWTILLIGTEKPPALGHRTWFNEDASQWWMWPEMKQVVALEPAAADD